MFSHPSRLGSVLVVAAAILPGASHAQDIAEATTPGILPAFITAGLPDPSHVVPSTNKATGSAIENLDIAFPLTLLNHGQSYVYSIVLQDYNYTGASTVSYKLTQVQNGVTVTLDEATITSFNTAPGDIWLWVATGKPIPSSPGVATLTGIVTYGSKTAHTKTTVVLQ